MPLQDFHPAVAGWFRSAFAAPTPLDDLQPRSRQILAGVALGHTSPLVDIRADYQREVDRDTRNFVSERAALSIEYFKFGIACPFLEDESCSIHPDRPMACREYLVSSPAENCRTPRPDNTDKLSLDAYPMPAVVEAEAGGWVTLVEALHYRDENPGPTPSREAPDILRELIGRLVKEE